MERELRFGPTQTGRTERPQSPEEFAIYKEGIQAYASELGANFDTLKSISEAKNLGEVVATIRDLEIKKGISKNQSAEDDPSIYIG